MNEESSVDNSLPGSSPDSSTEIVDPEESKPRLKVSIRPIGMEMDGVSSLVVASNEGNTKTRSGDVEQTNAPYALYSLDEEGNIKLTLFYFEVVVHLIEDETESPDGESPDGDSPSEEDNITKADSEPGTEPDTEPDTDSDTDSDPDSEADTQEEIIAQYVETIKKELTDAIQVVPAIIADCGRYILFSGCQYYINDLVVSDEVRSICEEFINSEKEQHKGDVFMIRKSDGALFDVSELSILRYKGRKDSSYSKWEEWCEKKFRSLYYNDEYNQLAEDSYAITPEGDLLVLGTSCIYKVEDNGDAIDFKPVTKSALDAFVMTPDGYLYLYEPRPSSLNYVNLDLDIPYFALRDQLCTNQKFEYECYAPDGKFSMLELSLFEDEPFYYLGQWVNQTTSTIYLRGLCLEDGITIKQIPISVGQSQQIRNYKSNVQIHSFEESPFVVIDEHSFYLKDSEKVISCTFNKRSCHWRLTEVANADQSLLNPENYDYSFDDGENFYGYKLVDGQISITKVSSIGILIEQEFVDVEIPHNSISVEAEFYEQIGMICVKLSGRTDDGGFWSRDYNLTTREESQIQIENLSVVTIVKIN